MTRVSNIENVDLFGRGKYGSLYRNSFWKFMYITEQKYFQLKRHLHTNNILRCLRHEQIGVNKFL